MSNGTISSERVFRLQLSEVFLAVTQAPRDGALLFFPARVSGRGGRCAACARVREIRFAARTRSHTFRVSAPGHASRARRLGAAGQLGGRSPSRLPEHLGDESERGEIPQVAARTPAPWTRGCRGDPRLARRGLS